MATARSQAALNLTACLALGGATAAALLAGRRQLLGLLRLEPALLAEALLFWTLLAAVMPCTLANLAVSGILQAGARELAQHAGNALFVLQLLSRCTSCLVHRRPAPLQHCSLAVCSAHPGCQQGTARVSQTLVLTPLAQHCRACATWAWRLPWKRRKPAWRQLARTRC